MGFEVKAINHSPSDGYHQVVIESRRFSDHIMQETVKLVHSKSDVNFFIEEQIDRFTYWQTSDIVAEFKNHCKTEEQHAVCEYLKSSLQYIPSLDRMQRYKFIVNKMLQEVEAMLPAESRHYNNLHHLVHAIDDLRMLIQFELQWTFKQAA